MTNTRSYTASVGPELKHRADLISLVLLGLLSGGGISGPKRAASNDSSDDGALEQLGAFCAGGTTLVPAIASSGGLGAMMGSPAADIVHRSLCSLRQGHIQQGSAASPPAAHPGHPNESQQGNEKGSPSVKRPKLEEGPELAKRMGSTPPLSIAAKPELKGGSADMSGHNPPLAVPTVPRRADGTALVIPGPTPPLLLPKQGGGAAFATSGPTPDLLMPRQGGGTALETSGPTPPLLKPKLGSGAALATSGPTPPLLLPRQGGGAALATPGPTPPLLMPRQGGGTALATSGLTPPLLMPRLGGGAAIATSGPTPHFLLPRLGDGAALASTAGPTPPLLMPRQGDGAALATPGPTPPLFPTLQQAAAGICVTEWPSAAYGSDSQPASGTATVSPLPMLMINQQAEVPVQSFLGPSLNSFSVLSPVPWGVFAPAVVLTPLLAWGAPYQQQQQQQLHALQTQQTTSSYPAVFRTFAPIVPLESMYRDISLQPSIPGVMDMAVQTGGHAGT